MKVVKRSVIFRMLCFGALGGVAVLSINCLLGFLICSDPLMLFTPLTHLFSTAHSVAVVGTILFVLYGAATAANALLFKSERLTLPGQTVCAASLNTVLLLLTAVLCDQFEGKTVLLIVTGSAVLHVIIWLLRTWRWKCRVHEANSLLSQSDSSHSLTTTMIGEAVSTTLLWFCFLTLLLSPLFLLYFWE